MIVIGGRSAAQGGDWPLYGRDAGAQRFSPLTQITPENVATLTRAWTFDTGTTGLQVTPLVIDNVMYVAAGNNVFALEAETSHAWLPTSVVAPFFPTFCTEPMYSPNAPNDL